MKAFIYTPDPLRAAPLILAATCIGCAQSPSITEGTERSPTFQGLPQRFIAQGDDHRFILCWQGSCPCPTPKWLAPQPDPAALTSTQEHAGADPNAKVRSPASSPAHPEPFTRIVYFEPGNSALSTEAEHTLQQAMPALQAGKALVVVGHADSTGLLALNRQLALWRARAVTSYLTIAAPELAARITAKSAGSDSPVASNTTQAGRRLNRRAEIFVEPAPSVQGAAP